MSANWNSYFTDIYNQISGRAVECSCRDNGSCISVTYTSSHFNDENERVRIRNYLINKCQSIDNDKIKYSTYWDRGSHIILYFTKNNLE